PSVCQRRLSSSLPKNSWQKTSLWFASLKRRVSGHPGSGGLGSSVIAPPAPSAGPPPQSDEQPIMDVPTLADSRSVGLSTGSVSEQATLPTNVPTKATLREVATRLDLAAWAIHPGTAKFIVSRVRVSCLGDVERAGD